MDLVLLLSARLGTYERSSHPTVQHMTSAIVYLTFTRTASEGRPAPMSLRARRRTEYESPGARSVITTTPDFRATFVHACPSSENWYVVILRPPVVTGRASEICTRPSSSEVTRIEGTPGVTGVTLKERVIGVAARYWSFPSCVATIVHVPVLRMETREFVTLQTVGVSERSETLRPDDADAPRLNGALPQLRLAMSANPIAWAV